MQPIVVIEFQKAHNHVRRGVIAKVSADNAHAHAFVRQNYILCTLLSCLGCCCCFSVAAFLVNPPERERLLYQLGDARLQRRAHARHGLVRHPRIHLRAPELQAPWQVEIKGHKGAHDHGCGGKFFLKKKNEKGRMRIVSKLNVTTNSGRCLSVNE